MVELIRFAAGALGLGFMVWAFIMLAIAHMDAQLRG